MKRKVFLLLMVCLLLSGCTPPLNKKVRTPSLDSRHELDLDQQSYIYQLILGEFAAQRGNFALSLGIYSKFARKHPSEAVLKKTANLALLAEKYVEAYLASRLWCQFTSEQNECLTVFIAAASKLDLIDGDFLWKVELKKYMQVNPGVFLASLFNYLVLVDVQASGYSAVLEVLESLADFHKLSRDHLDFFAILSMRAGDYDGAMNYISSYSVKKGLNLELIHSLITKGEKSLSPVALKNWINSLRKIHPNDKQLALWEALFLSKIGEHTAAKKLLRKLYSAYPNDNHVGLSLAMSELITESPKKAKNIFEVLLQAGYKSAEVNFYLGRISEIEERPHDAIYHYGSVSPDDGFQTYFSSQLRLAFVLAENGRTNESLDLLSYLDQSYPDEFIRISLLKGDILRQDAKYSDALEVFGLALQKVEYNLELLYARSLVAEKLGRVDILESDLGRILEVEPNNAEVLNALGYSLTNLTNRHEEALVLITKALTLMPESSHIIDSMGWVLFHLGELDDSLKYLSKAYSMVRDPEIAAHLIEVLWLLGQRTEAKELLEKAMKEFPADVRLKSVRDRFDL